VKLRREKPKLSGTLRCDKCQIEKYKEEFVGVHNYLVSNCKRCRMIKKQLAKERK